MEKTILVPLDFSEQSMVALEQSYNLAKLSKSSVTILSVIKTGSSFWGIFSDNEKKDFELKIEQKLISVAKEIEQNEGVEVGTIIRRGKVVDEIIRVSNYLNPQIIVMGTSSGTQITRKIIGSRALRIIKESKYPVISVKGKLHSNTCENILLPIDATKHTSQKVQLAIEMAKLFDSKIILSVLEKNNKAKKEQVSNKLKEIKGRIEEKNIECHTDFLYTENDKDLMAVSIVGFAHKTNADLIAIMTQQESGIADFFLGSLAQNIIFSSDIPVLTINPKNNN